nr:DUF6198 family protein [uncultured Caproiciproducens sp.]
MNKTLYKRMAMVCVGTFIMGFAVSLSIYAGLGTDPCTCMNTGLSHIFGMSFGMWQLIMNIIVLFFTFFFARSKIGFGTIVNMVAIGFLVDFFRELLFPFLPQNPTLPLRILFMLCGVVILAFTAALYMYPSLGVSPYDSIGFMLVNCFHIQYRWGRIGYDVFSVVLGWLFGGVVGVGTVITAFCMGPLIKFFGDLIRKMFPLQFDEP